MFVVTNYCQIYNIIIYKLNYTVSIQAVCTALLKPSVNLIWQPANIAISFGKLLFPSTTFYCAFQWVICYPVYCVPQSAMAGLIKIRNIPWLV